MGSKIELILFFKKNLLIYTTAFLIADQHTFMPDEK